ncbi:MAG: alpha/beta hydrolase [Synechococcales cyanobacterium T60_A2020_003]|nr:alpha/beta hydrolase [Synechococcales cyanobacterium T60_A2020_003]
MTHFFNPLSQHGVWFGEVAANVRKAALATVLLGCGSLFVGAQGAIAAETVTLRLANDELTITIDQLKTFAETGELLPEVQEFFDTNRQDAPLLRSLISDEVVVGTGLEDFLESSSGEFVVMQIDRLVSQLPSASTIDAIRIALRGSYENDGRFSILEIAELYPESNIYLDLQGLQTVYNDVKTFVERIRPALETAKEYLQDLLCDCESSETSTTATPASAEDTTEPAETVEPEPESTETDDQNSSLLPSSDSAPSLQSRECNNSPSANSANEAENSEVTTTVIGLTNSL